MFLSRRELYSRIKALEDALEPFAYYGSAFDYPTAPYYDDDCLYETPGDADSTMG